ncbi:hypothetical protein [Methylocella sp.]|uniref:hypothetical protein n=1 Tax=Methylocella sp. TaxID=1978226 RepID=UPI00378421CA
MKIYSAVIMAAFAVTTPHLAVADVAGAQTMRTGRSVAPDVARQYRQAPGLGVEAENAQLLPAQGAKRLPIFRPPHR